MIKWITMTACLIAAWQVHANEVDVVDAFAECDDTCTFHVTLKHADTGWDHYANRWDVLTPDGKVIGERVLYHPHVNEQPFTRSLSGVKVPQGIKEVTIRGNDSVHGTGGKQMVIKIPGR